LRYLKNLVYEKKDLSQKEYLYLIERQEPVLVKPAITIIPTKLEPWGLDIGVGFYPG
jgi:hypothetical protein